jgi:hypothetical protein
MYIAKAQRLLGTIMSNLTDNSKKSAIVFFSSSCPIVSCVAKPAFLAIFYLASTYINNSKLRGLLHNWDVGCPHPDEEI